MKNIKINVSITPNSTHDKECDTNVLIPLIDPDTEEPRTRAELVEAAIEKAVQKTYGKSAFWWADSGLKGYGQVMRRSNTNTGGADAVTYRATIDVSVPSLPNDHLLALESKWKEDCRMDEEMRRDYDIGLEVGRQGKPFPKDVRDISGEAYRGWKHGNADYNEELDA